VSPSIQLALQDIRSGGTPDEKRWQVGVAYWPRKHNLNLKVSGGSIAKENTRKRQMIQLQMQVFFY